MPTTTTLKNRAKVHGRSEAVGQLQHHWGQHRSILWTFQNSSENAILKSTTHQIFFSKQLADDSADIPSVVLLSVNRSRQHEHSLNHDASLQLYRQSTGCCWGTRFRRQTCCRCFSAPSEHGCRETCPDKIRWEGSLKIFEDTFVFRMIQTNASTWKT